MLNNKNNGNKNDFRTNSCGDLPLRDDMEQGVCENSNGTEAAKAGGSDSPDLLQKIRKMLPSSDEKELTLVIGNQGFLTVCDTGKGYAYKFYGKHLSELERGHLDEPALSLDEAIETFLHELGITDSQQLPELFAVDSRLFQSVVGLDYEGFKDHLFMRVFPAEKLARELPYIPHVTMEDLVITFYVLLGKSDDGMCTIRIQDQFMRMCGVDLGQLYEDAKKSSPRVFPAKMVPLFEMFRQQGGELNDSSIFPGGFAPEDFCDPSIVVTNDYLLYGAAVIFYPGVMEQIGEIVGCDYYIAPSSVHEMIIIPDWLIDSYQEVKELVKNTNDSIIQPNDRLTDNVYHYDIADHIFESGESFDKRKPSGNDHLVFPAPSPV